MGMGIGIICGGKCPCAYPWIAYGTDVGRRGSAIPAWGCKCVDVGFLLVDAGADAEVEEGGGTLDALGLGFGLDFEAEADAPFVSGVTAEARGAATRVVRRGRGWRGDTGIKEEVEGSGGAGVGGVYGAGAEDGTGAADAEEEDSGGGGGGAVSGCNGLHVSTKVCGKK